MFAANPTEEPPADDQMPTTKHEDTLPDADFECIIELDSTVCFERELINEFPLVPKYY